MVTIKKTWETVFFTAKNKNTEVVVELHLNYATNKYTICTAHQEMVSFNNDTIEISELKMEALTEIFKYVKKTFPVKSKPKK